MWFIISIILYNKQCIINISIMGYNVGLHYIYSVHMVTTYKYTDF